ncbi:hypothetical protein N9359_03525 [Luminiphilus sp.]|nr:hypothetical protein [Luminiphilus sp.]
MTLSLYPGENLAAEVEMPANGEGFRGFTLSHNMRSEQEVDELLNAAVFAGARLIKKPSRADWGGYSGYFPIPTGFFGRWRRALSSILIELGETA